jgi:hypothetical protein
LRRDGTGIRGFCSAHAGHGGKGVGGMADESQREPGSLEILSVGPIFREVDYRWLEKEAKAPPFQKQAPLFSLPG